VRRSIPGARIADASKVKRQEELESTVLLATLVYARLRANVIWAMYLRM
jgi:hypothetical protein